MSAPPYVPWYYGDYLRDTLDLNTTEHGAYMLLIGAAFTHGGALPPDKETLYRFAFAKTTEQRKAVERVLGRYWDRNGDGSYTNKRVTLELEHAVEVRKAQSEAGKRSADLMRKRRSAGSSAHRSPPVVEGSSATGSAPRSPDRSADGSASSSQVTTIPIQSIPEPPPPPLASDSSNPSPSASSSERACARDGGNGSEAERAQGEKPAGNGKVILNDKGEWEGLDTAQRLRWQAMFENLAIPDELDHAGQWLLVHPEERALYERQEDGLRAYLIRWLLREARVYKPAAGH